MAPHRNNIGLLRLLLACGVIFTHAAQLVTKDYSLDPIMMAFHNITLGAICVDGFFLLSGFLIAKSMEESSSLSMYLERRALRIYPAFLVAWIISFYVVGSIVGLKPVTRGLSPIWHMFVLDRPPGFDSNFFFPPTLNMSMWTISYEFRCYLLAAMLGVTGLLSRKSAILGLTVVTAVVFLLSNIPELSPHFHEAWLMMLGPYHSYGNIALGDLADTARLTTMFLIGTCFYKFKANLVDRVDGRQALAIFFVGLIAFYKTPIMGELIIACFGGVALFWLALKANLGRLQKINDRWDISYGVYLYGWPISILILLYHHDISVFTLFTLTILSSLIAGTMSWFLVEKWAKNLARNRKTTTSPVSDPIAA